MTSQPSPLPVALSTILVRAYAIGQPSLSTIVQKVVANRPREAQKVTWPGMAGWEAAGDHLERKFCPVFWKGPVLDGKDLLHIHSRRQKPQPDNELQCTHNMNWQGYLVTSTRKPWETAGNWDSGKPRTGLPLGHKNGSEPGFHVSHLGSSCGDLFLVSSAL